MVRRKRAEAQTDWTGVTCQVPTVATEFGLVLRLRKITIRDYLATRDSVAGTAFYLMLGLFALMPLFVRHG